MGYMPFNFTSVVIFTKVCGMYHPLLNTAIKAARNGSKIITRSFERLDNVKISSKGEHDFVTEVDKAVEEEIVQTIHAAYPNHAFLAEEGGISGEGDYVWVIDPIDGTINFIHGIPCCAISIAVKYKGVLQHGVIYDPLTGELFTASRGKGAYLNDRRIRVSKKQTLHDCLIATGFPYRNQHHFPWQRNILSSIFSEIAGFRCIGSAALALAYVAAGRFDGLWLFCLSEWDVAAGILLVQEAGGLSSDFEGKENITSGSVVAGNPKILKALLKKINAGKI